MSEWVSLRKPLRKYRGIITLTVNFILILSHISEYTCDLDWKFHSLDSPTLLLQVTITILRTYTFCRLLHCSTH
jgi:hypothetical protein